MQVRQITKAVALHASRIFEDDADPHFITAKSNILIILLCITTYFIHELIKDYLNAILLGFLSGVAYLNLLNRFIDLWQKDSNKIVNKKTVLQFIVYTLLLFLLPWIRKQTKQNYEDADFSLTAVWECFIFTTNPAIRIAQIYLLIQIVYGLFGEKLKNLLTFDVGHRGKKILSAIFAILTVIVVVVIISTVAIVLTTEFGRAHTLTKKSVEKLYDCQFSPATDSEIPHCTDKISGNLLAYIPKIDNQTDYLNCVNWIQSTELNYIGSDYFDYEENICSFLQYAKVISPNIIESVTLQSTGELLASLKDFIFDIINIILNISFSVSTFFAIFLVTVFQLDMNIKHIFILGSTKAHLVENITKIFSSTIFIAMEHLALGIFLFSVFRFTDINLILSILLSIIAVIPLIQCSFLVIIIAALKIWLTGYYVTSIACASIYWYFSRDIIAKYYNDLSLNKVITHLSVIFGIYQYGVSGIFYGPLLILLFQCAYEELFNVRINGR